MISDINDILQDGYLFELTYQLQCSCRQMIWRPEDSQPLPLPGPSSNFAALVTRHSDRIQMGPIAISRPLISWGLWFVYASSTSFWGSSDIFLIGQFSRKLFHSNRMLWLGCFSQYIEGRFSGGVRERVRQPGSGTGSGHSSGKVPKEVLQHVTYFSLCLESHRNFV